MLNVIPSKFKHSFNAAVIWEGFKVEDVRSLANFYFSTRLMSHKAKGSSRLKRYLESENFFSFVIQLLYMWRQENLHELITMTNTRIGNVRLIGFIGEESVKGAFVRRRVLQRVPTYKSFAPTQINLWKISFLFLTNTNKPATLGQRSQLQIHRKRPANGPCILLKSLNP